MRIALVYKNFAANRNISHIGLGVAAINTSKVLRRAGFHSDVWAILSAADLEIRLQQSPVDHVVISAPWIPSAQLQALAGKFPAVHFTVVCHSNVGFLQADTNGTRLVRETMDLEQGTHNIHVGGNTRRFTQWVTAAFGVPCAYLPNLYYLDHTNYAKHHVFRGCRLKVGIFGATRPLKNIMTGTAAALEIARSLGVELELWLSAGRAEGGHGLLSAVQEMVNHLPHVTLKLNGWQSWPQFRKTVASMDLLLQPSYTESFNMVTADGVAEGVTSVVSDAIEWAPSYWMAEADNALDIARVGRRHLFDPQATTDGLNALKSYVDQGVCEYTAFFKAYL